MDQEATQIIIELCRLYSRRLRLEYDRLIVEAGKHTDQLVDTFGWDFTDRFIDHLMFDYEDFSDPRQLSFLWEMKR